MSYWRVRRARHRDQLRAIPLEEIGVQLKDARAGADQHVTVGQQRRGTVGNVEAVREVRTWRPGLRAQGVDGGMASTVAISSGGKDGAVRAQHRGPHFIGAVRVPELDNGAARTSPRAAEGV